ncbi:glutathione hydrolase 6 [Brachyhypopomus gauderio]|uniref:glutathione hydrolase 6 n=1 Tax=Brachyhypopomus gauderio TaxID=698409 RepID=UPI0040432177
MVQSTVRYTKLPSETQDEIETGEAGSDEDRVTIYTKQPTRGLQIEVEKKDTWVRVVVALVLLGVVLVFMILECDGWWSDPGGLQGAGCYGSHSMVMKTQDEHDHHPHMGDAKTDDHNDEDHHHHHHHHDISLYHHAVVLTASANCSRVGKELLQEGGTIVDAAVASLLCLGVVHPHTAGIGGEFSAILYNHTSGSLKAVHTTGPQMPSMTYGIPSILQGVKELHSQWGRSEWSSLFKGAIELAEDGFLVDSILGRAMEAHEDEISTSDLCNLFCDANGHLKSAGMLASNRNLAELLRGASLNESHFQETLAMKLAEDLSPHERPAFFAAVQRRHGEINEPLIAEGEKYTVLSDTSPHTGLMLSVILEQIREQSLAFQGSRDLNSTAASYANLFNSTQGLSKTAETNPDSSKLFGLNMRRSHIGVLDRHGSFIIMSVSLNTTWGSRRLLPTSGVILSSFTANLSGSPYLSFPLVLKISTDSDPQSDGDEGDDELEVIAVAGGLPALFNAAVLLHNRVDSGMSPAEAVCRPLLHLEQGISSEVAVCLSAISNGSEVYMLLPQRGGGLQEVDECTDDTVSMLFRLHADHVSAHSAPAATAHSDGY